VTRILPIITDNKCVFLIKLFNFAKNLIGMKRVLLFVFVVFTLNIMPAQSQEVPYTLADRDKMVQIETKLDGLTRDISKVEQSLNDKIDKVDVNLNKRMDRLEDKFDTYFTWGFGMVLAGIFGLFGFIIYDRRSVITPVKRDQDKMLEALRMLAKEDTKIREALKKAALW
jgi:translation elongation factor EF-G